MRGPAFRAALVVMLAAGAACTSEGTSGEEAVATNQVDMPQSYRFDPEVIEIEAGTTVTWTNNDQFPHTVHLLDGSEVDEQVPIGESVSIPFEEPGTIDYECSLHPQEMTGTVIVR